MAGRGGEECLKSYGKNAKKMSLKNGVFPEKKYPNNNTGSTVLLPSVCYGLAGMARMRECALVLCVRCTCFAGCACCFSANKMQNAEGGGIKTTKEIPYQTVGA